MSYNFRNNRFLIVIGRFLVGLSIPFTFIAFIPDLDKHLDESKVKRVLEIKFQFSEFFDEYSLLNTLQDQPGEQYLDAELSRAVLGDAISQSVVESWLSICSDFVGREHRCEGRNVFDINLGRNRTIKLDYTSDYSVSIESEVAILEDIISHVIDLNISALILNDQKMPSVRDFMFTIVHQDPEILNGQSRMFHHIRWFVQMFCLYLSASVLFAYLWLRLFPNRDE